MARYPTPRTSPRFKRSGTSSRSGIGRAVSAAVNVARAVSRIRTVTQGEDQGSNGGVTQQHDKRVQYRKKRYPKQRKRKWVKFVKKVKAVTEKGTGTQNFLFNDTHTSTAVVGSQAVTSLMMYGGSKADETVNTRGYSDINKIMNIVSPTPGVISNVSDLSRTGNLQFISAVLDVTITNVTGTILELDMYEIYFKGNKDLGSNGRTIEDCYQYLLDSQIKKGGGDTSCTSRGWTPFNCGAGASQCGFKIYKKTKFHIGAGQVITHQKRDPRSHWIGYNQAAWQKDIWGKKFSYGLLFIGKTVPGYDNAPTYVLGCTRSYNGKIYQFSGNTDQTVS